MKDKFCILFNFDSETQKILRKIHEKMLVEFPHLVSPLLLPRVDLPYHMTMIGAIKLEPQYSDVMVKQAIRQLKAFNENILPVLEEIKPSQIPGNFLGIRLKFLPGSYVLTGIPEKNVALAKMLGAEKYDFDLLNHITLFQIKNSFLGIDEVLSRFKEIFLEHKDQLVNMVFIPEVWKKEINTTWIKYKT
jgi:hypothetical protein